MWCYFTNQVGDKNKTWFVPGMAGWYLIHHHQLRTRFSIYIYIYMSQKCSEWRVSLKCTWVKKLLCNEKINRVSCLKLVYSSCINTCFNSLLVYFTVKFITILTATSSIVFSFYDDACFACLSCYITPAVIRVSIGSTQGFCTHISIITMVACDALRQAGHWVDETLLTPWALHPLAGHVCCKKGKNL